MERWVGKLIIAALVLLVLYIIFGKHGEPLQRGEAQRNWTTNTIVDPDELADMVEAHRRYRDCLSVLDHRDCLEELK